MTEWPIALSTGCFYRRPIFDILGAVRDAGFELIEVCSFPAHLNYNNQADVQRAGEQIRQLGLRPFSFHAPFADQIDITSLDDGMRESAVQELLRACEAAAAMGCENIVLHPGPERSGRPPEEEFLRRMGYAGESLNRVAVRCRDLGVQLLLENMLPHLLFGPVREMMYLLGQIETRAVGTCLDTGHAHLAGEMRMVTQKLSGHLKMLHINDNDGHSDAHMVPGDGTIDWPEFIAELRRNDFRGVMVLELAGNDAESTEQTMARAVRARTFMENVCREN